MANQKPMSDDEVETLLHDVMRQIADARYQRGTETERGAEALRLAMVGPYSALLRLEKINSGPSEPLSPPRPPAR
jgi:hypothetical protein